MEHSEELKQVYTTSYAGLMAYVMAVAEKIGKEEALRILARLHSSMAPMLKEHLHELDISGNDARAGAKLFEIMLAHHTPGLGELMTRERVEDTPERVVFHHSGYCPIVEAGKMLGITPKDFCPIPHNEGYTPLLQVLNPALQLRLGKIRPDTDYCEVIIELKSS